MLITESLFLKKNQNIGPGYYIITCVKIKITTFEAIFIFFFCWPLRVKLGPTAFVFEDFGAQRLQPWSSSLAKNDRRVSYVTT